MAGIRHIVVALAAIIVNGGELLECAKSAASDTEAATCFEAHQSSLSDKSDIIASVDELMSSGFFDATEKLVELAHEKGISQADLSTIVFQSSSKLQRRLQALQDSVSRHSKAAGIPPAFEWAQSPDSVFLNIKFAHKLDTPATLGCEAEPPVFEDSAVTLRAECRDKRKTFLLSINTYKPLLVDNCTWSMSSVGRASLTLKKAVNGTWPRLLASDARKPPNMHVWWAMKEAHDDANKAWEKKEKEDAKNNNNNKAEASPSPSPSTTPSPSATPVVEAVDDSKASEPSPTPEIHYVPVAVPVPIPTPEPVAAPEATTTPVLTPTPVATPEDPIVALEKAKARELGDASTGEASELRSLDAEAKDKRKGLEDKYKAERAAIEREISEARKNAIAKWEEVRQAAKDKYEKALEAARKDKVEADAASQQFGTGAAWTTDGEGIGPEL